MAQRGQTLFVTAIEGTLDVAHHVIASESRGSPDTNAATFSILARHCVITDVLAGDMPSAAGFRNVLVHQYAVVDDARVIAFLDRLDELDAFVGEVTVWLEQRAPSR